MVSLKKKEEKRKKRPPAMLGTIEGRTGIHGSNSTDIPFGEIRIK